MDKKSLHLFPTKVVTWAKFVVVLPNKNCFSKFSLFSSLQLRSSCFAVNFLFFSSGRFRNAFECSCLLFIETWDITTKVNISRSHPNSEAIFKSFNIKFTKLAGISSWDHSSEWRISTFYSRLGHSD